MHILQLTIPSKNLYAQKAFYTSVLGFKMSDETSTSFTVKVGSSLLTFEKSDHETQYHFAFNIPSNQINSAQKWLQKRVTLLPFEGDSIIDFPAWDAKAIYFYDEDHNILEFISRKNLGANTDRPFSSESILHLSEIGIPTARVADLFTKVSQDIDIQMYSGDKERFCAMGAETGLLILMNYTFKKWIPTMEQAYPFPIKIRIKDRQNRLFNLTYQKEVLGIEQTI